MVVQTVSDMRWQLPAVLGCMVPVSDGALNSLLHYRRHKENGDLKMWLCHSHLDG